MSLHSQSPNVEIYEFKKAISDCLYFQVSASSCTKLTKPPFNAAAWEQSGWKSPAGNGPGGAGQL